MIKRQLIELNFDKIKKNYNEDTDLFNDYLFVFREKIIFITKFRKYYKLCTNYPKDNYLYMDSNFYVSKISLDLQEIITEFETEIQRIIYEVVPF